MYQKRTVIERARFIKPEYEEEALATDGCDVTTLRDLLPSAVVVTPAPTGATYAPGEQSLRGKWDIIVTFTPEAE